MTALRVDVVDPGVVRIVLPGAANAYLFIGRRLALVDCGSAESEPALLAALGSLEVPRHLVSLVVLTHEHAGHAGATRAFPDALVAAHPLAAAALRHELCPRPPDLELEDGSALHLGGFSFRVVHTPGHTAGSICLYERERGLLLTGDTAQPRGDHLSALDRLAALPARIMLPGHGQVSDDPQCDLRAAVAAALRPVA